MEHFAPIVASMKHIISRTAVLVQFAFFPDGVSCWDIQERHEWDGVIILRVRIFSKFKCFRLARKTIPALGAQGITDFISGFLIHI